MGLIPVVPGGANLTGNIAVTMVLALFTFATILYSGSRGLLHAPGKCTGNSLVVKITGAINAHC